MGWIISLVVGLIIGCLASLVIRADAKAGLVINLLVGVTGTLLGFWSAGL